MIVNVNNGLNLNNMERGQSILITHFVNPHNFWYTKVESTREFLTKRDLCEKHLKDANEHKALHRYEHRYDWREGEKVAIHYLPWNKKTIRGEYLQKLNYIGKSEQHLIWAIDYGFPFATSSKFIYNLPSELSADIGHVHWGGIADIYPASLQFDFNEKKRKAVKIPKWSTSSCSILEEAINDFANISFIEKRRNSELHHWGDLEITNHLGKKLLASEILLETYQAVEANDFKNLMQMENSYNRISLICNNINDSLIMNEVNAKMLEIAIKDSSSVPCDMYTKSKVSKWQNQKCDQSSNTCASSERKWDTDSACDDIQFEDSASNCPKPCEAALVDVEISPSAKSVTNEDFQIIGDVNQLSINALLALNKDMPFNYFSKTKSCTNSSINASTVGKTLKEEKLRALRKMRKDSAISKVTLKDTDCPSVSSLEKRSHRKQCSVAKDDELNRHCFGTSSNLGTFHEPDDNCSTANDFKHPTCTEMFQSGVSNADRLDNVGKKIVFIPAGYDEMNLIEYRDKNHWHRKKSTLNDHVPHDQNTLFQENNSNRSESSNEQPQLRNSERIESLNKIGNQNFRFTRANTDKYKTQPKSSTKSIEPAVYDVMVPDVNTNLNSSGSSLKHGHHPIKSAESDLYSGIASDENTNFNSNALTKIDDNNRTQRRHLKKSLESDIYGGIASDENTNCNFNSLVNLQGNVKEPKIQDSAKKDTRHRTMLLDQEFYDITSDGNTNLTDSGSLSMKKDNAQKSIRHLNKSIESDKYHDLAPNENINPNYLRSRSRSSIIKVQDNTNKQKRHLTQSCEQYDGIVSDENTNLNSSGSSLVRERDNSHKQNRHLINSSKQYADMISDDNSNHNYCGSSIHKVHVHAYNQSGHGSSNNSVSDNLIELPLANTIVEVKDEPALHSKTMDYWILAHSKVEVYPLKRERENDFLVEIREAMLELRINKLLRVQAYSWSHLQRNNSMFVVFPKGSGKTWSYLPCICSIVSYRIYCSDKPAEQTYGPMAIILVTSSLNVEKVYGDCRRLMQAWYRNEIKPCVAAFGQRNYNAAKLQLLNSSGILITTPACMLRLLKDNEKEFLINPHRLRHLVVDDIDLMYLHSKANTESVIKHIIKLCNPVNKAISPVQLVFTSRDWNPAFIPFIKLSSEPLLLIGNFLEASVYGKSSICINLVNKTKKFDFILNFLQRIPLTVQQRHTIIFCNVDDEVESVEEMLISCGYECLSYMSNTTNEMLYKIDIWKSKKLASEILICTDDTFPELKIQSANYLIHFSIPSSWTKFTSRYYALSATYANLIALNFQNNMDRNAKASSLVLLDEDNSMQLPRLVEFMQKHNQTVHSNILTVSKQILTEREESRIDKTLMMCRYVLEFGECLEPNCTDRHSLTSCDRLKGSDGIPKSGELRILILKVMSPTHFIARLLQHKPLNGHNWRNINCSSEYSSFFLFLNLHYSNVKNLVMHWPVNVGDICVYKYQDAFRRARVLDVKQKIKNYNFIQDNLSVVIDLIDLGKTLYYVKANSLLVCDRKFKSYPAQAINIRLMNVVPHDDERIWDLSATNAVRHWLFNDINYDEHFTQCGIKLAMKHTIWVNNIVVMQHLPTINQFVYKVDLKRSLLEKQFGVLAKNQPIILQIAEEKGFLLDEDKNVDDADVEKNEDDADEETNADDDVCKENTDANTKRNSIPIQNKLNDTIDLIEFSSDSIDTSTAHVTDIVGNENDKTDKQLENTTKHSNEAPIEPSQQCKEIWSSLPLNTLAQVEIGDENENGNWSNIYVQLVDHESYEKFTQLCTLIENHVEELQNEQSNAAVKTPAELRALPSMHNCIIKYDKRYQRAKLMGIFDLGTTERIYRFFLCDYACFVNVHESSMGNDTFYESTKEIIEYIPYQAIHCTLIGIQLNCLAKRYLVKSEYLFINPVVKNAERAPLNGLAINSYGVQLYESNDDKCSNDAVMLNKSLIDLSMALVDPKTEKFLKTAFSEFEQTFDYTLEENDVLQIDSNTLATNNNNQENFKGNCVIDRSESSAASEEADILTCEELLLRLSSGAFDDDYADINVQYKQSNALAPMPQPIRHKTETENHNNNIHRTFNIMPTKRFADQPPLITKSKTPKTIWYESDIMIYLVIYAPDITDYYLKVTCDIVLFAAIVNGELQTLVLNLLGHVDPANVSHQIRGLSVVVRLAKTVYTRWPRLTKQIEKFPWLMYNINSIETDNLKNNCIMSHRSKEVDKYINELIYEDSYGSDDEMLENVTPIENSEDVYDPFA